MPYHVEFAARAIRDLEFLYAEKNAAESQAAARWFNGLEEALYTLGEYPERCPVTPEARRVKRNIRHLLYGNKPHIYRVIYDTDERRKTVWILTIRHGARKPIKPSDLT